MHAHTHTHTHTPSRGNRKRETGKRKAASVSIYSSVGDYDQAEVRVNILHAARLIVCSLSLLPTHRSSTDVPPSLCLA